MRRAILSVILLTVALAVQLTVVNRLPLPGTGPDLVLLSVVALGLGGGPAAGAVTGFCAGLGLDIAPPGSYLIGQYALVFCVIGYLCGRLRGSPNRSALLTIALAATVAAAGEAASAALGLVLSDPQVTWSAVRQVLPSSVAYDAVVTPFLLYAVIRVTQWAGGLGSAVPGGRQADGAALLARGARLGGPSRPAGWLSGRRAGLGGAGLMGGAGLLGGTGWLAGPMRPAGSRGPRAYHRGARTGATTYIPRAPRLKQAAARSGDGWLGGGPRTALPAPARGGRPGRLPRLRPASGTPGSAVARSPRQANVRRVGPRRRDGSVGRTPGLTGTTGVAGAGMRGRGSGPPGSAFRSRRPGGSPAGGRPRSGAPPHRPRFRPDRRMPGGSSSAGTLGGAAFRGGGPGGAGLRGAAFRGGGLPGGGLRGAAFRGGRPPGGGGTVGLAGVGGGGPRRGVAQRMRPSRGLRLRTGRRHDGVLGRGGTVGLGGPGGGGRRSRARRGVRLRPGSLRSGMPRRGVLGGGTRRRLAGRPGGLRLGSGRRGDATFGGGVLTSRGRWARAGLGRTRRAEPRFRAATAAGRRSLLGRRSPLGGRSSVGAGRRSRFSAGRTPFLGALTLGRLGGRSTVWRIGSRRVGGLR